MEEVDVEEVAVKRACVALDGETRRMVMEKEEEEEEERVSNSKLEGDHNNNKQFLVDECDEFPFPSQKQAREVSNDDIRSEVSNPQTSPKEDNANSSLQDISSQPQPQPQPSHPHPHPHPHPQQFQFHLPDCGEVTSTCSEETLSCDAHRHNHQSDDEFTSRVVLEIPQHAALSGVRKITFKFSKKRQQPEPQPQPQPQPQPVSNGFHNLSSYGYEDQLPAHYSSPMLLLHADIHFPHLRPYSAETTHFHLESKLSSNKVVVPTTYPSNVKKLLSTGILDGARVKYVSTSSQKQLEGIISGGGYLCGCSLCDFTRVLSAYEFEQHAGVKTRHPNNHIFLENGRPIYSIIQELKTAPLSLLDQVMRDLAGSSVNQEYFNIWKATLHQSDGIAEVGKRHSLNLPRLPPSLVGCSVPALEESVSPASCSFTHGNFKRPTYVETTEEQKRIMNKSSFFASKSVVQHKKTAEGGTRRRDNDLHRLLFMPNGLPDGAELAYFVKGQRILGGYKQGNGIVCNCCNKEVSPSQFEAHAGMAARRQPYRHIYTSNGLTLHDIAISLANGQNLTTGDSDDMCAVCGYGGDLIFCHGCPRAFHAACLDSPLVPQHDWHCPNCKDKCDPGRKTASGEPSSISRPIVIRLTRVVTAPEIEIGGCVVCRGHDFSAAKFDERTVMLCDQCEKEFHVGCLRSSGLCDLKELPKDKWFCCDDCSRIHMALQNSVSVGAEIVPASLSHVILRKHADRGLFIDGAEHDIQWRILSGKSRYPEHLPFLSRSAAIFRECFDPIVAKSGRDLIPVMVYGRNISGQEFGGMYCVVLIVRSVVVSAGLLRIFGREVAELPIVATSREHQGKGYFQALFSCIEKLLCSLNVENIVLPAAEEAESIWTKKFGFRKMSDERLSKYMREVQLTIFKGTSMLEKAVQPLITD